MRLSRAPDATAAARAYVESLVALAEQDGTVTEIERQGIDTARQRIEILEQEEEAYRKNAEAIKEKSRAELLLGVGTLGRHGKFAPYVAGESFTLADLYFMYSLNLACGVGEKLFGLDLLEPLPKAKALLARLNGMPNAQKVEADRQAAMPAFMAMIAAKK